MKANRLSGTIFNQFYISNPDRKPMKPLPPNLEKHIKAIEDEHQQKLQAE